jgi:hypothetical protein
MKRRLLIWFLAGLVPVLSAGGILAASTLSQGYLPSKPVQVGQLVSLTANPGAVEPATPQNTDSLAGVAIPPQSALLTSGERGY